MKRKVLKNRMRANPKMRQVLGPGLARTTSPRSVNLLERRYRVWVMRKDGYTLQEIAESLGVSVAAARLDLVAIAKRLVGELAETVEENRQLQIARLDALLKKYQPLAEDGKLAAAGMVLSIETRRSKLLALDTPETKRLEVSGIREYVGVDLAQV